MNSEMIKIGNRAIGKGQPVYIIAELSANHGGDINRAKQIIRQAKQAGADAVKLQTYRADTITLDCDKDDFKIPSNNSWNDYESLYSLYEKAFTPWEWHDELFKEARAIGIDIFSSPFDHSAVDFLEALDAPAYKIASPEITDIPLLRYVAKTGKPIILSTGISELDDVELAVSTLRANGCKQLAILKCTSAYPTPYEECNLATIPDIARRFECISGLSDHTLGLPVPIAATVLGASIIEKHFILDKADASVDAFFSLDKNEFESMVSSVRNAEKSIGIINYSVTDSARKNMLARRSLYFSETVRAGEFITLDNIRSVRPGFGMHPKHLDDILGKQVLCDMEKGDRVTESVILDFDSK